MKARNILIAGVAGMVLAGCANDGKLDMLGPKLTGGEWVAIGDNTAVVNDTIKSTLAFDSKGQIAGTGGCNTFSGKAKFGPTFGLISTSDLSVTEKACEEKITWQEEIVLHAIETAQYYNFNDDGDLIITAKDGAQTLWRRNAV